MAKTKQPKPLRREWQTFIERLLFHGQRTRAYMEAYPGVTRQSAYNAARVLLKNNPAIREALAKEGADQKARTRLSSDRALMELARIAFADPLELVDENGCLLPIHRIGMNARRAIASTKVMRQRTVTRENGEDSVTVTESVVEYKFYDKLQALDKMLKHFGLLKDPTPLEELLNQLPPYLQREITKELSGQMPEALAKIAAERAEQAAARKLLEILPPERRVPRDRTDFRSEN